MTDILISGICGHMGRNVLELALADAEIHCVGGVDLTAGELQGVPVFDSFADAPAADAARATAALAKSGRGNSLLRSA